jgi:hypothetical protein
MFMAMEAAVAAAPLWALANGAWPAVSAIVIALNEVDGAFIRALETEQTAGQPLQEREAL